MNLAVQGPTKRHLQKKNSVDNDHCIRLPIKFSVNVEDRQDKIPTMYWLPKLH